jgi:hypothetical protein
MKIQNSLTLSRLNSDSISMNILAVIPVPITNATNGRANAAVCGMSHYRFCTTAM